jgi:biopolymer transport protein ExbB/TolQ
MAEKFVFLSLALATVTAFVSTIGTIVTMAAAVKRANTLEKVEREITVLQHIFAECVETSQNHPSSLPESLARALLHCHEEHRGVSGIQERVRSEQLSVLQALKIIFRDDEVVAKYHSFRGSVLLLRDLCSE